MRFKGNEAVEVAVRGEALNAESPVWDERTEALWWIDVHRHRVHRFDGVDSAVTTIQFEKGIGCLALREAGGLVLALHDELAVMDLQGRLTSLARLEFARADIRFNDGKCDSAGRLWVGTFVASEAAAVGALYRLDPDLKLHTALDRVTISNGIAWSLDESVMYYIDSATRCIEAFDFDAEIGSLSRRRVLARVDDSPGRPDGLTVDAEGHLWVAICDGGQVRRYLPDGELAEVVNMPVTRVTSCCFGGSDLEDLYITSARFRLSDEQLSEQPLAGSIFVLRPGVAGRPPRRFRG